MKSKRDVCVCFEFVLPIKSLYHSTQPVSVPIGTEGMTMER